MTQDEIDTMWQQAMQESIKDGQIYTRYHFAKVVAERALAEHAMQEVQRLGQEIEQEPSSVQQAYAMAQVCLDLHDAIGCKWGDNVYFAIDQLKSVAQPPQRTEQEPVGSVVRWVDGSLIHGWFGDPPPEGTLLYTTPPPRTWIGLEGAEFGWFCHTDFLNARKYTKEQRKKICNQLLSEAQSWDIGEYQLMMHDSTKLKETT